MKYIDRLKIGQFKQAGITLVALVVTIIVLLILAGVTISLALGGNGLLSRTIDASLKTKESQEKETIHMAALAAISKNKEIELTATELQEELNEEEAVVYDLNTELKVKMKSNRIYTVDLDGNIKDMSQKNENTKKTLVAQLADSSYGTEENQYQITCIEDLMDFMYNANGISVKQDGTLAYTNLNNFSNKYFKLLDNLDFKSIESYEDFTRKDYGDINKNGKCETIIEELSTSAGFMPISQFSGTLDGNGLEICNIYINKESGASGLISTINSTGIVKNLGLVNSSISGTNYVGSIAGSCAGTIEKCFNTGNISGVSNCGGILGYLVNGGTVSLCYNTGNISYETGENMGGIIGMARSKVEKCYNLGNVEGSKNCIGGIVGSGYSVVDECFNGGCINGYSYVAGIVGRNYGNGNNAIIKNCYNYGGMNSTNKTYVGAITGCNYNIVQNCYTVCSRLCGGWSKDAINSYYLASANSGREARTEEFMRTQEFVDILNTRTDTTTDEETGESITTTITQDVWKQDTANINNGFPIFKWQK